MAPTPPSRHPDAVSIRAQLLRGIAGNRVAGLHFPGYFLDTQWGDIASGSAHVSIASGPHCCDTDGGVDVAALAILADTALATSCRAGLAPGARLATVHLQMQFTGAPATGTIAAKANLLGLSAGSALHQSLTSAALSAHGRLVCHATAEFVALDPPAGVKLAPLPWQHGAPPPATAIDESDLEPRERLIVTACESALAQSTAEAAFIERFWSGAPHATAYGASNRVAIGPHIGNRVGHVQGGILFGIAANTARAAVPTGMRLSSMSAWYISPGHGKKLAVKSRVVHAGRSIAVVRTEIKTGSGERVLEAVTHHVARKRR